MEKPSLTDKHNEQSAEIANQEQRFKTLGVRIEEDLHAQLSFIAGLSGNTLADEIRAAIASRVKAAQEDPDLVARAETLQAELQREAEARRAAIAGFFGGVAVGDTVATPPRAQPSSRGRRKAAAQDAPDAGNEQSKITKGGEHE